MTATMLQHFEQPIAVSFQGSVIDGLGDIVQQAAVNLLFGDRPVGRAQSSEDGTFNMSDLELKLGIHKLRVSKLGHGTSEETFQVTESMSGSTQLVMLRLTPTGWNDPKADPSSFVASPREGERRSKKQRYASVRVFFATDRKFQNVRNVYARFGAERSNDGTTSLGVCQVSIPEGHRLGQLENPIFKLHLLEDPERHVALLEVTTQPEDTFFENFRNAVEATPTPAAFVFVHGYNVTFAEAVRRTAQMAFDLNFKGAPICYSWPSHGQFSQYMADEATVEWTIQHFREFILKCLRRSGVKEVHLIAHSMGNRALAHSLSQLSADPSVHQHQIHQIILAAPDIDRGVFVQIARDMSSCWKRTTLYASSSDLALRVSQQFHAYPRAGEAGDKILLVTDVDTIDASSVGSGFLGHSYYGQRTALTDIYDLITHGTPPPRLGLREHNKQGLTYWLIQA